MADEDVLDDPADGIVTAEQQSSPRLIPLGGAGMICADGVCAIPPRQD